MPFDISAILDPGAYDHPVANIELIETHISWVVLTGAYAYKIKKPVDFGFLDFSTLQKRRDCCIQELELNRRLAPGIYLDVVRITQTDDKLSVSGDGEIIEYAVKMAQFPQSSQLDNMLAAGELKAEHMDAAAHMVASFHQVIAVADESMDYGDADTVYQPVEENFIQIKQHLDSQAYDDTLSALAQWSLATFEKLKPVLSRRKRDGFVRECHGDMHLRNMVWLDGKAMAFDCIEFNPRLRWIDVISEAAFLVMDLQDRQQPQLANRFLNSYLEITGDYAGLALLPFYLCYRAMVRAKVGVLRLEQEGITEKEREQTLSEFESYLELATGYMTRSMPRLIITRGLSASGKSTVAKQLVDSMGLIRIRSDVERKRLFAIPPTNSASTDIDAGIYSSQASMQTYDKLIELATLIIDAGFSVIVDAAFLKAEQRTEFQQLAGRLGVPYVIMETTASADVLRERIRKRKNDVSDADLEVLEHQLTSWQPLENSELSAAISVDTEDELNIDELIRSISER